MNHEFLKDILSEIGKKVCDKVYQSLKTQSIESMSAVHKEGADDTIYQIDKDVEDIILPLVAERAEEMGGVVLLAEGIGEDTSGVVLPEGTAREDAAVRIIMDPIDGTRNIMYDKRSAFFLSAVAPNKGEDTAIQDIEVAVMTELTNSKGYLSDTLWAIKGKGAHASTRNLLTGEEVDKKLTPSKSPTIIGGFGQIARFFPPGRDILAKIEDELIDSIAPDYPEGKTVIFEDQYISSGGQLYEMLVGHDRFVADIRKSLFEKFKREGKKVGHVCHPYDICCVLIGQEAGVHITDVHGNALNPKLDLLADVDWIAYANENIRNEVEAKLQGLMKEHGVI